ncbi:MAG: DUF4384 domain-containing protein [Gemmatimonadota bacterium]|nr:DUF4384 domain-containing protein [Gemmatimonadota bacterium]
MKLVTSLTTLAILFGSSAGASQAGPAPDAVEARLWLDRGDEVVVQRGERLRIRYRTSEDAFMAIFRIDTDGRVSLLHPSDPRDDGYVRGGRDESLVLAQSPFWTVRDDPGVGYLFMVASPEPLDFSRFEYHRDLGWDLSSVGAFVYDDPYLAMDDFVAALIPDWEVVPYGLDFVTYHVGEPRSYPRFLCYDCHTSRSFQTWNPYAAMCSSYRIVIYDDPYFYPGYRYAGTRVVFPRPIRDRPRYEVAERRPTEAWAPIVRVREAPGRPAEFKETPTTNARSRRRAVRTVPSGSAPAAGGSARRRSGDDAPAATGSRASPSSGRSVRSAPAARRGSAGSEDAARGGSATRRPTRGVRGARSAETRPSATSRRERPATRSRPSAGSRPAEATRGRARPSTPSATGRRGGSARSGGERRPARAVRPPSRSASPPSGSPSPRRPARARSPGPGGG